MLIAFYIDTSYGFIKRIVFAPVLSCDALPKRKIVHTAEALLYWRNTSISLSKPCIVKVLASSEHTHGADKAYISARASHRAKVMLSSDGDGLKFSIPNDTRVFDIDGLI